MLTPPDADDHRLTALQQLAATLWGVAPRAVLQAWTATRKPRVLPRIVLQMGQAKLLGRKVLRGAELAVTYRCQAHCPKCSCNNLLRPERSELTREQLRTLGRRLVQGGAVLVNFTGGEPLLRPDIVDIVRDASRQPWLTSITTNGLLATPERIATLADAGLNMMQISLSSPVEQEHDAELGVPGATAAVRRAVTDARRHGLVVLINVVLTHEVLGSHRLREIGELARRSRSFLSLVFPAQVGGWSEQSVRLGQDEMADVRRNWLSKGYVTTDTETCYRRGRCPAGSEKIYITPYGDLFPCPFIHTHHGNVLDQDIVALWRAMAEIDQPGCCNVDAG